MKVELLIDPYGNLVISVTSSDGDVDSASISLRELKYALEMVDAP